MHDPYDYFVNSVKNICCACDLGGFFGPLFERPKSHFDTLKNFIPDNRLKKPRVFKVLQEN